MSPSQRVVVVGVDFSEMGDDAILEGLTQLAGGAAGVARFVYVHDPRVVDDDDTLHAGESGWGERLRVLTALRQRVRDVAALAGLRFEAAQVRVHARIGHTVAALIDACIEYDADLLVVGTHARLQLDRRILGPVADMLVRTAPCPVLIARPKCHRSFDRIPTAASPRVARVARASIPASAQRQAS